MAAIARTGARQTAGESRLRFPSASLRGGIPNAQHSLIQWTQPTAAQTHTSQAGARARGAGLATAAKSDDDGDSAEDYKEGFHWAHSAIPTYLSATAQCGPFDRWIREAARKKPNGESMDHKEYLDLMLKDPIWLAIRSEAERHAAQEPILSSFLWASILSHKTFQRSLAFILANRLADDTMMPTELFDIFHSVLERSPETVAACLEDCVAHYERDPACTCYSNAMLYYKGYHALQAQRICHVLWQEGREVLALSLQSKVSQVLAVDIHPATKLGYGILLDHGTGVVIGETAVVGNYCSILQGVTLGGTGKASGDRHPKVGDGVLIGANATVLGNIKIGSGAQIAAGSLVLKPVVERSMVAGTPARQIGVVVGRPALDMNQWIKPTELDPYDTNQPPALDKQEINNLGRGPESVSMDAAESSDEVAGSEPTLGAALGAKMVAESMEALQSSEHSMELPDGMLPSLDPLPNNGKAVSAVLVAEAEAATPTRTHKTTGPAAAATLSNEAMQPKDRVQAKQKDVSDQPPEYYL